MKALLISVLILFPPMKTLVWNPVKDVDVVHDKVNIWSTTNVTWYYANTNAALEIMVRTWPVKPPYPDVSLEFENLMPIWGSNLPPIGSKDWQLWTSTWATNNSLQFQARDRWRFFNATTSNTLTHAESGFSLR